LSYVFLILIRRPLISTLFPYTTLFRSFTFSGVDAEIVAKIDKSSFTGDIFKGIVRGRKPHRAFSPFGEPPGLALPAYHPPIRSLDRKSTRLNSSHLVISYAVFCLKKKT